LLDAIPLLDPNRAKKHWKEAKEPSGPVLPESCIFQPRCLQADPDCVKNVPELHEISPGHWVKCLAYDRVSARQ
jgi:oligopeptide/dipeptide ABC transporter ATP-binding protein